MSTDTMKDAFPRLVITDRAAQLLGCTKDEIAGMDMETLAARIFERGLSFSVTASEADEPDRGKLTISGGPADGLTALL